MFYVHVVQDFYNEQREHKNIKKSTYQWEVD